MSRFIEEPKGLFGRSKSKPETDSQLTVQVQPDGRQNARFYQTILILMMLTVVVTVALCMWFASTKGAEETAGTSSMGDSGTSSVLPESSSEEPSSSSEPDVSSALTSEQEMILAAEQVFGNNSLDRKHTEAMEQAATMQEMLSVYDDTLEAWRKQLNAMVTRLGTYTTEDQKALQSAWEESVAEKIRNREDALSSQGGTIAQVELAEYTCMLYRQRGLALFVELYRYDRTYTF